VNGSGYRAEEITATLARCRLERINKELKRRSRVVGAFPSDKSLMRLAGCILMDINEDWITGGKYLTMEVE